ncbi:MAG TPA: putative quinol monooxygenase [Acetobacteraceae bacterium]|jgi:quinol monooxygenase YgiN|nr:putative quinol monooxygenase [Acetobacteraceae bacterium]
MGRYTILVEFDLAPADLQRFLPLVRANAASSLQDEPGCERFDVLLDPAVPGRVVLYEIYRDRAAFDGHLASPHFARFDADIRAMVQGKRVTELELLEPAAAEQVR